VVGWACLSPADRRTAHDIHKRKRSTGLYPDFPQHAYPSPTISFIREMRGETTIVTPGSSMAGTW
jgi:hypothetical protein